MSNQETQLQLLVDGFENHWRDKGQPNLQLFLTQIAPDYRLRLAELLIPIDIKYRQKSARQPVSQDYRRYGARIEQLAELILNRLSSRNPSAVPTDPNATLVSEDPEAAGVPASPKLPRAPGDTIQGSFGTIVPDPNRLVARQAAAEFSPIGSGDRMIGAYKLLKKLGEGGMGTVWMAEQEKPLRRRVALKLIKAGIADQQIIGRFEAERQAVAIMNHENIAKILDAGTTESGQPYFVMELVSGIPLNNFCDVNQLSIDERLNLFIPICQAVQHAHQKGIIHRDLKPSNILVGLIDGIPVPKVIDFGLAKALESQNKLTDKTVFTEFGQVVGTLQYMSPEQADLNQLDIDTRTDIYSLGVMLYELLTGSPPIDADSMKGVAILQILATIREHEPQRPSVRLSSSTHEAVNGITNLRKIDATRLKTILRGELDWIVMKAIEKDRTRRYETAAGFADDLKNFLAGDVVGARPPSTTYRISKYVRKHKGLVASLASIAALLIFGILASSWFGIQANRAKKIALDEKDRADKKTLEVIQQKEIADRLTLQATESAQTAQRQQRLAEAEAERATAAEKKTVSALEQTEVTLARSNYFVANARWNEQRAVEARELLQRIPAQYRNFEWYLDQRLFEGGDVTLYGHQRRVNATSFSPEGTRIASASSDGTIKIWDACSGAELQTLKGQRNDIKCLTFSPDGTQIVSGSQDPSQKWTATMLDGTTIASGTRDSTITIWDVKTGKEIRTITGHTDSVLGVSISPDGKRIASGSSDQTIKLWDAQNGELLQTLTGHSSDVTGVVFSPDGTQLASGGLDGAIKLWDSDRGTELLTMTGHRSPSAVTSVSFSPDGAHIASGGSDNTVKIWDRRSGAELRSLTGHQDRISCVTFSPAGTRIATASYDNTIKLWDARRGNLLMTLTGHADDVLSVSFSLDGARIASGSNDNTIKLWDARRGEVSRTIMGPEDNGISSVSFSPDGTQLGFSDWYGSLQFWDARSGEHRRTLPGHEAEVLSVLFSSDGTQIVSGYNDGIALFWDARSGEELRTVNFSHNGDEIWCVAFSSDGMRIASGSIDSTIKIWDAVTGEALRTLMGHTADVVCICFSPDGMRIASGSSVGIDSINTLKIWDAQNGNELHTLTGHQADVVSVSFSPDGKRIASGSSDRTIKIWDAQSGELLRTLTGHSSEVTSVAFSPDGSRIVSSSKENTIRIWDPISGEELRTLTGHSDRIYGVVFSADGRQIASRSADNSIKIWDASNFAERRTLTGHANRVDSLSFSPDHSQIISSDENGKQFTWDAKSGNKLHEATWEDIWDQGSDPENTSADGRWHSADGRWLLVPVGKQVCLVDLEFKNIPDEKIYREWKARLDPRWHLEQANLAEQYRDFYAAAFHWAWIMKSDPEEATTYDALHAAQQQWIANLASDENPDSSDVVPLAANTENQIESNDSSSIATNLNARDPNKFLALIVREMLKLPRGEKTTPDE